MKRIRSEKEQYWRKRAVRFIRRVQALVLTAAVLVVGGLTVNAASVGDVFDAQSYADRYPDLKAAFGYDAQALLQHYLTYGIAEGREAGGLLDVRKYREEYPDLDTAFGDNWDAYVDHFLTYGIYEGRDSGTDFNALDYADRYSDLKEVFGDNVLALYQHYQTFGKTENREARSEKVVAAERQVAAAAEAARQEAAKQEAWENLYPVLTDADGNVPDLGGMEIIIRDWWSTGQREADPDTYLQALYDYQDWAMERYNFTIKQVAIGDWGNAYDCDNFMEYVDKGGDDANYIFVLWNSGNLLKAERDGYSYDLSTLDCLKFGEEKWVSGVHEYHTIGDNIYAMNFNLPEPRDAMYFNKSVLRDAGIDPDDIYKWQESGEWTWNKFVELCEKITRDTDGDGKNDVWALNGQKDIFYGTAVYSNNGDFVGMENGKYVNGLASSETQEALDWAVVTHRAYSAPAPKPDEVPEEIFDYYYEWLEVEDCLYDELIGEWYYDWDEDKDRFIVVDGIYYTVMDDGKLYEASLKWDYFAPEVRQGVWAFYTTDVNTGRSVLGLYSDPEHPDQEDNYAKLPWFNKDDVGMVCFPKGPNASDYTNIYTDNAYVIPSCYDAEKAWNIAFALNAWTMPISGYDEEEAVLKKYYQAYGDTESVDLTIRRLLSNGRVTYHEAVPELEIEKEIETDDGEIVTEITIERINLGNDLLWRLHWDDELIKENYGSAIRYWDLFVNYANEGKRRYELGWNEFIERYSY